MNRNDYIAAFIATTYTATIITTLVQLIEAMRSRSEWATLGWLTLYVALLLVPFLMNALTDIDETKTR